MSENACFACAVQRTAERYEFFSDCPYCKIDRLEREVKELKEDAESFKSEMDIICDGYSRTIQRQKKLYVKYCALLRENKKREMQC
jgi:hypothetical protein